jgi:carboxypeptidase T
MIQGFGRVVILAACVLCLPAFAHEMNGQKFVQISAKDKQERSVIANEGVSIEAVRSDSVWAFANDQQLEALEERGFSVLGTFDASVAKGGHETMFGFPPADARFHDFAEMTAALTDLGSRHADLAKVVSIGKSLEGRDIWAIHINSNPEALASGRSNKPGVIFMGNHHAREHLSAEIPLMLAQHLLANKAESSVRSMLDTRDIWIIPMVNPDGVEWDIASTRYRMWRKNRRNNGDGTYGVDLNRNYGFKWGTGGSSKDPSSDVYMGKTPFSEPETQVIRDFVSSQSNAKVLLSFHTFSELVLYPWGHTYDDIVKSDDKQVFEKMAKTMAGWNGYTPQQASDLYIASGDTTDWAYGELGIFAFTFELSPKSMWDGGFYPGAKVIDRVFNANLKPCLYMIDMADNPYRSITEAPELSPAAKYETNPMALLFPYKG